jgi:hypothetical protein
MWVKKGVTNFTEAGCGDPHPGDQEHRLPLSHKMGEG